jgi:hypothetical protein
MSSRNSTEYLKTQLVKLKQSVKQQVSQIFMKVYMNLIMVKFNSKYFVRSNLSLGVRGPRHHQDIISSDLKKQYEEY